MKANRLVIGLTLANFVLLAGVVATRARADDPVQPVVRAQLIELVDAAGKVRGQLKADAGGEVTFRMFDAKGDIRTEFGADENGSGVAFMDNETSPGVRIFSGLDQTTHKTGTNIALSVAHGKQNIIKP